MSDDIFYTFPPQLPASEAQLERDIERGRVYRLADAFFKFVFGRQDRADLFLDLLNSIVFPDGEHAFSSVRFLDREFSPERKDGRGVRLDLAAILDDGEQVNLEVQIKHYPGYINRSLYYLALLHSNQLNRGKKYYEVNRTISIHIINFNLLEDEPDFRNSYAFRNETSGKLLSEDMRMIFIELPKYVRQIMSGRKPVNKLEKWLGYFAGLEGRDMADIAYGEPMIEQALDIEKLFLMDYEQRINYILDMRAIWDEANHDAWVKEREERIKEREEQIKEWEEQIKEREGQIEGREEQIEEREGRLEEREEWLKKHEEYTRLEGETEGQARVKIEMAKNLLQIGDSVDKVMRITGLCKEEIQKIADTLISAE